MVYKIRPCWILDQARSGTLVLGPEIDINFVDPKTNVRPLMVAAAFWQTLLASRLSARQANVHAVNMEGITALTSAAVCAYTPGTIQ